MSPFHPTPTGQKAILEALSEYLLITLPVAFYVVLEAIHKDFIWYCLLSPEWAIATVFLCFQGPYLYTKNIRKAGRKLADVAVRLAAMTTLAMVVIAAINAYASLDHPGDPLLLAIRLGLFVGASLTFFTLVAGSKMILIGSEG